MSAVSNSNFDLVPDEILLLTFENLSYEDLLGAKRVCTRFDRCIDAPMLEKAKLIQQIRELRPLATSVGAGEELDMCKSELELQQLFQKIIKKGPQGEPAPLNAVSRQRIFLELPITSTNRSFYKRSLVDVVKDQLNRRASLVFMGDGKQRLSSEFVSLIGQAVEECPKMKLEIKIEKMNVELETESLEPWQSLISTGKVAFLTLRNIQFSSKEGRSLLEAIAKDSVTYLQF